MEKRKPNTQTFVKIFSFIESYLMKHNDFLIQGFNLTRKNDWKWSEWMNKSKDFWFWFY